MKKGTKTNKPAWNSGKKGLQVAWNKGLKGVCIAWNKGLNGYKSGKDNCNYKGGKPKCVDCGKELGSYRAKRCPSCNKMWQKGENIYNYKGGFTPNPERTSYAYKSWRLDVFKRDWFTCKYPGCGYKGKDIQAHHIKRAKDNPELLLDQDNGITLCKEHHNKTRCKEKYYERLFIEIIRLWQL